MPINKVVYTMLIISLEFDHNLDTGLRFWQEVRIVIERRHGANFRL